jgi:hypothetical protein
VVGRWVDACELFSVARICGGFGCCPGCSESRRSWFECATSVLGWCQGREPPSGDNERASRAWTVGANFSLSTGVAGRTLELLRVAIEPCGDVLGRAMLALFPQVCSTEGTGHIGCCRPMSKTCEQRGVCRMRRGVASRSSRGVGSMWATEACIIVFMEAQAVAGRMRLGEVQIGLCWRWWGACVGRGSVKASMENSSETFTGTTSVEVPERRRDERGVESLEMGSLRDDTGWLCTSG